MKSLTYYLEKYDLPDWLTIFLFLVLLLRIPSFFEPFSYGDEMIYLTLGEGIRQGLTLYRDIYDNKPPLLYLVATVAGSVFWFKVILAAWNLAAVVLFYKLAETLFPKEGRLQKVATIIFGLLTTLPLLEGNIANAELFLIGPVIAAFLLLFRWKFSDKSFLFAGFSFGVATLFKVPAAFDLPVIVGFLVIKEGISPKLIKRSALLVVGLLLPLAATFVWYYFKGALPDYFKAAFLQNVGYLSSWRPDDAQKSFLIKNAPLLTRAGVVALGFLLLWWRKHKLSPEFIFASLWLLTSLFAAALSERPYPHYLIQAVPPAAILLAILFSRKTLEQSLAIIPLTLAFLVPVYYKFWSYPVLPYYVRFVRLATGQINQQQYLASFGNAVPRNYDVAKFLTSTTRPNERVLVWGDSPPVYALARRLPPIKYVADYHIKDFSGNDEIARALTGNLPAYVVVLPGAPAFPWLTGVLNKKYFPLATFDGAVVYKKVYN